MRSLRWLLKPLPLPHTRPPRQSVPPGTAGIQTRGRSCCSQPLCCVGDMVE